MAWDTASAFSPLRVALCVVSEVLEQFLGWSRAANVTRMSLDNVLPGKMFILQIHFMYFRVHFIYRFFFLLFFIRQL